MIVFEKKPLCHFTSVEEEDVPEVKEPELPIIPNYLSNPPFMYSKADKDDLMIAQNGTQNGSSDHSEDPDSEPATLSPTQEHPPQPQQPQPQLQMHPSAPTRSTPPQQQPQHPQSLASPREGAFIPVSEQNGVVSTPTPTMNGGLAIEISPEPHHPHVLAQNGAVCPTVPSPGASSGQQQPPISRQQSIPQQLNGPQAAGSMPAFQPFFFTSTFPVSCQGERLVQPQSFFP